MRGILVAAALVLVGCDKAQVDPPKQYRPQQHPAASVTPDVSPTATPSPTPTPTATPEPPIRGADAGNEPKMNPKASVKALVAQILGIQEKRWRDAEVKPSFNMAADRAVMLYIRTKERYEAVARMRGDGVPAPVIFALHMRESDNSFKAHLHEGSSLLHRTRFVPKGRLLPPDDPPYEWEHSAEDAIYVCDKLQGDWSNEKWSLDKIESYNGTGYRRMGVPSPYLWSGTDQYSEGKYVSDGHYRPHAVDQQLGVCAVLKRMQERGIKIEFDP